MMGLLGNNYSPIGIDVNNRTIEAVQLHRIGSSWRLSACASLPRTNSESELNAEDLARLNSVLFRQGFKSRRVVTAVPKEKLISSLLELPPKSSPVSFDQVARIELARQQKCDPKSFEMAWWELPPATRPTKNTPAFAVACRCADANSMLSLFDDAGFDVERLDTRGAAAIRACAPLLADTSIAAILDLGYRSASLFIIRHGVIVYDRTLFDAGMQTLEKHLAEHFSIEPDAIKYIINEVGFDASSIANDRRERMRDATEAIASHFQAIIKDLELSFTYANQIYSDSHVQQLLMIGEAANIPGLAEYFQTVLPTAIRPVSPAELVECATDLTAGSSPSFVTALGLAKAAA